MRLIVFFGGLVATCFLFLGVPRPATGVSAGTTLRMDVPTLVRYSGLVLEGRVLSVEAREGKDETVETECLVAVERTFVGEDQPYRSVRFPGGVTPEGNGMLLAGMPSLEAGEEVLLFLTPESLHGVRMPVGLAQGKFRVLHAADGTKLLERQGQGVALLDPGTGTLQEADARSTWSYAEVVAEIEATLAGRR